MSDKYGDTAGFLARIFNMPTQPLLEHKPMDDAMGHHSMVKAINPDLLEHPRDRINDGIHPFRAIAEDQGLTPFEAASALGMEIERYMGIVTATTVYTVDDILNFCDVFDCLPYDLAQDHRPLDPEIRDALLFFMEEQPYLLTEDEEEEARLTLVNDATDIYTIKRLKKLWDQAAREGDAAEYVREFLGRLMRLDGRFEVSHISDLPSWIEGFRDEKLMERDKAQRDVDAITTVKTKHWKALNKLGHKLYPTAVDSRKWPEIYDYLRTTWVTFKKDAKKLSHYYATRPDSIGRDKSWPYFSTTTLDLDGQKALWPAVHRVHAQMVLGYFQGVTDEFEAKKTVYAMNQKLDVFDKFVTKNIDLLRRFQNRQRIMHSDAMPLFMNETTRKLRQQPPELPPSVSRLFPR